jgi:hypothetical protein
MSLFRRRNRYRAQEVEEVEDVKDLGFASAIWDDCCGQRDPHRRANTRLKVKMLWIDAHRRKSGEHAATRPADGRSEYPPYPNMHSRHRSDRPRALKPITSSNSQAFKAQLQELQRTHRSE